jgi:hypothetical protein
MHISIGTFHKTNLKEINALYEVLLNSLTNENVSIKKTHLKDFYQDFVRYMYHNSIRQTRSILL